MKLLRGIELFNEYAAKIAGYLILALVAVVCFDVIMRYAMGRPTAWAYDAALHLFSISFLLSGAWVLQMSAHVRVDVIYARFTPRTKAIIEVIFILFFLFPVCYYLLKDGTAGAYLSWKVGEVSKTSPLHEPIWPLKTFIPIAFLLLTLQGVVELIKNLIVIKNGKPQEEN